MAGKKMSNKNKARMANPKRRRIARRRMGLDTVTHSYVCVGTVSVPKGGIAAVTLDYTNWSKRGGKSYGDMFTEMKIMSGSVKFTKPMTNYISQPLVHEVLKVYPTVNVTASAIDTILTKDVAPATLTVLDLENTAKTTSNGFSYPLFPATRWMASSDISSGTTDKLLTSITQPTIYGFVFGNPGTDDLKFNSIITLKIKYRGLKAMNSAQKPLGVVYVKEPGKMTTIHHVTKVTSNEVKYMIGDTEYSTNKNGVVTEEGSVRVELNKDSEIYDNEVGVLFKDMKL